MTELSNLFIEIINVDVSKLEICYITHDLTLDPQPSNKNYPSREIPVFWALYQDKLLYAICNSYRFGMLEGYYDWKTQNQDYFNWITPTQEELCELLKYKPQYFIVDLDVFLKQEIRDSICQWEMDIITKWNREEKINKLLNEND